MKEEEVKQNIWDEHFSISSWAHSFSLGKKKKENIVVTTPRPLYPSKMYN